MEPDTNTDYGFVIEGPNKTFGLSEDESTWFNFETIFKALDQFVVADDPDPREEALSVVYDEWNRLRSTILQTHPQD